MSPDLWCNLWVFLVAQMTLSVSHEALTPTICWAVGCPELGLVPHLVVSHRTLCLPTPCSHPA